MNANYCWHCGVATVFDELGFEKPSLRAKKELRSRAEAQVRYEEHRRKQMHGRRLYAEKVGSQNPHKDAEALQYHLDSAMQILERLGAPESLGARISFFKTLAQVWWAASRLPPG